MAVPDFQSLLLPVRKVAGDEKEHNLPKTLDILAERFSLSDEDRAENSAERTITILQPAGMVNYLFKKGEAAVLFWSGAFQDHGARQSIAANFAILY